MRFPTLADCTTSTGEPPEIWIQHHNAYCGNAVIVRDGNETLISDGYGILKQNIQQFLEGEISMENSDLGFEFEMNIIEWPDEFQSEMVAAMKDLDVDVFKGSAFTGADVLAVMGVLTEPVLKALTSFFQSWSKKNAEQKIIVQVGDNRIEMHGFTEDDFEASRSKILEFMKEMKQIDNPETPT